MTLLETGVLVGRDGSPIYWHTPHGRSAGHLPDSGELWTAIWTNRHKLLGFAHSHPGSDIPAPSQVDLSTFSAIEKAIGRRLTWWITSLDTMIVVTPLTIPVGDYTIYQRAVVEGNGVIKVENLWLDELRRLSYNIVPNQLRKET